MPRLSSKNADFVQVVVVKERYDWILRPGCRQKASTGTQDTRLFPTVLNLTPMSPGTSQFTYWVSCGVNWLSPRPQILKYSSTY